MRMPTTGVSLEEIPVIEVNRENIDRLWPHLILSIRKADLIALDLELSGLGERAAINASSLEERYAAMRQAATTRSVLSLGIALFERRDKKKEKRVGYKCQVFNVLSLCAEPFTMEPDALRFLADHSFDFNRYVRQGVSYHAAHQSAKSCPLRSLLDELLSPRAPIALHNGLVDLVFLYAHFYSTPPPTLSQFVADLADLFPSGEEQDQEQDEIAPIVDSKFLAEYQERMPASYLEYVFRKSQRDNFLEASEGRVHVNVSFGGCVMEIVPSSSLERVACSLPEGFPDHAVDAKRAGERLCAQFANHGFCRKGAACTHAHDVDLALDVEKIKSEKARRRRKRRLEAQAGLERNDEKEDGASMTSSADREESTEDRQARQPFSVTGAHRAGVDAFMTGFSVLFHARMSLIKAGGTLPTAITNRIPLSGKDRPLHLVPSRLVECSATHRDRVMLTRAARNKADAARAHV